jgi:hypothetical protein
LANLISEFGPSSFWLPPSLFPFRLFFFLLGVVVVHRTQSCSNASSVRPAERGGLFLPNLAVQTIYRFHHVSLSAFQRLSPRFLLSGSQFLILSLRFPRFSI